LQKQAKVYKLLFGCYPVLIQTDKIYATNDNRKWYAQNKIRLEENMGISGAACLGFYFQRLVGFNSNLIRSDHTTGKLHDIDFPKMDFSSF